VNKLAWLRKHVSLRDFRYLAKITSDSFRSIPEAPGKPNPAAWKDDLITVAWLGHATVLMNFLGVKILTDPALRSRIGVRLGPFTIGPKRYVRPALTIAELPPLDIILLTHAHMDHLDRDTLRRLDRGAVVITARATRDLLAGMRFPNVIELDWDDSTIVPTARGPITIAAFRVRHWGARMRHDDHRGYNGYLIERRSRRVCVAGDTAFTDFSHLAAHGEIELMAVPIGAYNPWIASHCTPEQAVEMANQAGAKFIFPIHHQTFKLSLEPMAEPIARFTNALAHAPHRIAARSVGDTFIVPDSESPGNSFHLA
jgi:L-ascorbate metabolism protein UlaG (beta-lactamase superfamily)